MRTITSARIPEPKGHYSPAVEHGGLVFVSGQLPIDPETGDVPASIEDQVTQTLENVDRILTEAGTSKDHVLQMRLYVSDILLWDRVNAAYASFFGAHRPARAIVPVGPLHFGCLIEVEATAVLG